MDFMPNKKPKGGLNHA